MNVRLIEGDHRIAATNGKVVIMRGPMVYCFEETDNKSYFTDAGNGYLLNSGLKAEYKGNLLGGVVCIKGTASFPGKKEGISITAIPYFAWCNREKGQMKVWLPYERHESHTGWANSF